MVLKFKPKLNLKIILKGSKTIMNESKNRRGLTQVKAIVLHINKQDILIYYDNKEIHAKKILFLAVLSILTYHMQNIGKEYLDVFITEPFLFGIQ